MSSFDCLDPHTPLLGDHLIEASAGTGKTFAIEHLVIRLLLAQIPLDCILIMTFTREATRTIKMRLRHTLCRALQVSDAFSYLVHHQNNSSRDQTRVLLKRGLATLTKASIFTIHGFCHRMLKEHGNKGNVIGDLFQVDPAYRSRVKEHILRSLHAKLDPTLFSRSQLRHLFQSYSAELVDHLTELIEGGWEIKAYPTFLESYQQFEETTRSLPRLDPQKDIEDLSLFNRIAPHHIDQMRWYSLPPSPARFDQLLYHRTNVLEQFKESNLRHNRKDKAPKAFDRFSRWNARILPVIEQAKHPTYTLLRLARQCRQQIKPLLIRDQLYSYDDLLKQMKQSLDRPEFFQEVHQKYRAVIVDEFQDTDSQQWEIIKRLFIDCPVKACYLIGDPKQSIYSFRGVDEGTYRQAAELLSKTGSLSINYRSEPQLIHLLNRLFSLRPLLFSEGEGGAAFHSVSPSPKAVNTRFSDGKKPIHFFVLEKKRGRERRWPSSEIEENKFFPFIAQEIEQLIEQGVKYQEVAILVKDRYQGDRVQKVLSSYRLPTFFKGHRAPISLPLSLFFQSLFTALSPSPSESEIRSLLAHPFLPYTHQELLQKGVVEEGRTLLLSLNSICHTRGFASMLTTLMHHQWKPAYSLAEQTAQQQMAETEREEMRAIIEWLLCTMPPFPLSGEQIRQIFNRWISNEGTISPLHEEKDSQSKGVTIITMHMSKGLEFPIVFTPGLISRHITPSPFVLHQHSWHPTCVDSPENQSALHDREREKLRMLYVCCTRAKKRLYLPALIDPSCREIAPGQAAPMELFLNGLPPLKEVLAQIGISYTDL